MTDISNDTDAIRELLQNAKVIALVGHSDKPDRDSYIVAEYLRGKGYTVYPVNPTVDEIDGRKSCAALTDVPEAIDVVDVFRGARHLPRIVDEAIAVGAKAVWGQLEIAHEDAAAKAEAAGLTLVMDRCMKIEYEQLMG